MAEFPCRLAPATLRLKELIATRLGAPSLLFCNQRLAAGRAARKPQSTHVRQLIEMVDWCRYVVDREPTSVVGTAHASQGDAVGQDYLVMSLDFSADDWQSVFSKRGRYIMAGLSNHFDWHRAFNISYRANRDRFKLHVES